MEVSKYFNNKKKLYAILLSFIEESSEDNDKFQKLINNVQKQKIVDDPEEFEHFLRLLVSFADNYNRTPDLIKKIEQILIHYKKDIKKIFSNTRLLEIFENNKLILLFMIKQKIIKINEINAEIILNKVDIDGTKYCHFFLPEIKNFVDSNKVNNIKDEMLKINSTIAEDFDAKRQKGQNDNYLSSLIQEDAIDEFIEYVNKTCISNNSLITHSIFETNSFLIENQPSLIEYAAFYGSIQIFQYLRFNNVEMKHSIWLYAIHGNNPEIIHLLEENQVELEDENFEKCFLESIKCHSKNISSYIMNNKLNSNNYSDHFKEDHYIFNIKALRRAAKENKLEIIYHLLSSQSKIETFLFSGITELTKVSIPPSITSIGEYSFARCTSLSHVSITSSVNSIDHSAFNGCKSLKYINIPSSVVSIGDYAFCLCAFPQIAIPYYVTSLGSGAFAECKQLKYVSLSAKIKEIKNDTFSSCPIKQILIPSSVFSINCCAFYKCRNLKEIWLPSSLKYIEQRAFESCISIEYISIPQNVCHIYSSVFSDCSSLREITIPSIYSIDESTFFNCSSLEKITFDNKNGIIKDNAFKNCSSLKKITIPNIESIGQRAFQNCSSLVEITFLSNFIKLGSDAFDGCTSLVLIKIPHGLDVFESAHSKKTFGIAPTVKILKFK